MIWDNLRGHRQQIEMFRRAIDRRRWAQSYLFTGTEGIGKRQFARLLAQCLFCRRVPDEQLDACGDCPDCRQMQAGTHPDFLLVERPEGKNVLPISLFVGEGESRGREGLCYDITLRPMSAERRIAVIDDAHLMNAESANALLKTLEEPPAYASLILISPDPDSLLPTIRSRCQQVRFSPLSAADISQLLVARGVAEDSRDAEAVAALSEGSVLTAMQLLQPELRELRDLLYERLAAPPGKLVGHALAQQVTEAVDKLTSDAAGRREHSVWLVRFCAEFFRRCLREMTDGDGEAAPGPVRSFAGRFAAAGPDDLELVTDLIDEAAEAETRIQGNTSVSLCLESLFDGIARRLRQAAKA